MATCQTLLDDLNDLIDDATNAQVTQARKIRYLNWGQMAMFPKIYRIDTYSETIVANTWEYQLDAGINDGQRIINVELETANNTDRYDQMANFMITQKEGAGDLLIVTGNVLPETGSNIRITAARPLTEFSVVGDTYTGPAGTETLPVLYALAMIATRSMDNRLDHRRYPTITGANGVTPVDLQNAATYWMSQFELLLDRFALPMPAPMG